MSEEHNCDAVVRADDWAMSGHRQTGDKWKCPGCGRQYVYQEDEAEGGGWYAHYWRERTEQDE